LDPKRSIGFSPPKKESRREEREERRRRKKGEKEKGITRVCQGVVTPVSLGYPQSVFNKFSTLD